MLGTGILGNHVGATKLVKLGYTPSQNGYYRLDQLENNHVLVMGLKGNNSKIGIFGRDDI